MLKKIFSSLKYLLIILATKNTIKLSKIIILSIFFCFIQLKSVYAVNLKSISATFFDTSILEMHEKTYSIRDELSILDGMNGKKLGESVEIPFSSNSTMLLVDNLGVKKAQAKLGFFGKGQITIINELGEEIARLEIESQNHNYIEHKILKDNKIIGFVEKTYFSKFDCNENGFQYEPQDCIKYSHNGIKINIKDINNQVLATLAKTHYKRSFAEGVKDHWVVKINKSLPKEEQIDTRIPLLIAAQESHVERR